MTSDRDPRRYGVIEVRRITAEIYLLTIDGQTWSEVEWSASRQRWCIQDAAGQCLTHVEHIVGQDLDLQTAIRLAKRMIVNGTMPTPEEAEEALRLEAFRQTEPPKLYGDAPLVAKEPIILDHSSWPEHIRRCIREP